MRYSTGSPAALHRECTSLSINVSYSLTKYYEIIMASSGKYSAALPTEAAS